MKLLTLIIKLVKTSETNFFSIEFIDSAELEVLFPNFLSGNFEFAQAVGSD
jgi:hypothetical protein